MAPFRVFTLRRARPAPGTPYGVSLAATPLVPGTARLRPALAAASVLGAMAVGVTPGAAQTSAPTPAQMDQLQQQIQALQRQLQSLQEQVNTQKAVQNAAPPPAPAAPPGPRVVQSPTNRFSLESADGQYSIGLTGRLHLDVGDYMRVDPQSPATPSNLSSGFNARRARIGVAGKIAGDWTYTFIYDAGNSNDATPRGIEFAQVNYRGFENMAIDIGYSDTFFTIDESTNTNDIMFLERATPQVIATLFNTGDFRSNVGVRYFTDRFWLGAYGTGPTQGQSHAQTAEQFGAFQRGTVQLFRGVDRSLHLGFGASQLLKAPNSGSGTARSITLSDTPELRIDPTPILNTGPLGSLAHPVTGGTVFNLETAAAYKNFFWQGEYFHYQVNRRGLEQASFNGGYGQMSWTLTGESRKYIPESGAYSAIIPDHPFSLSQGGWGAWELAARLSYVDLDDNFTPGLPLTAQPSAVAGGKQTSFTVGLNWYVNTNMRFMLNYVHADIDKDSLAGASPTTGATVDAIALRTQLAW